MKSSRGSHFFINISFLSFTLFVFLLSTVLKIKLNMDYNPTYSENLQDVINVSSMLLIILMVAVNFLIVFFSAFGTYIFLAIVGHFRKYDYLKKGNTKTYIYLLYFVGHTILNLGLSINTVMTNEVYGELYINIINLTLYIILSILLYNILKRPFIKKDLLISVTVIFLINGIIPIFYLFKHI